MALKGSVDEHRIEAVFRAPRFDPEGRLLASACLKEMRLNGQVVQSNVFYDRLGIVRQNPSDPSVMVQMMDAL